MRIALAALLLPLALLAGCSHVDLSLSDPPPISGVYHSSAAVGDLGDLQLTVQLRSGTKRNFFATLHSDQVTVNDSPGRGTLGNDHLILDFDIGKTDDFYFQGDVVQAADGTVTGLTGTFIFPRQPEQLPVQFTWVSAPPTQS